MKPSNSIVGFPGTEKHPSSDEAAPHIAERIRRYRTAENLTQSQLAEMMQVTRNTICNWEAGRRRPDIEALPTLCRALGITYYEFFGEEVSLSKDDLNLIEHFHDLTDDNQLIASKMIHTMLEVQDAQRRRKIIDGNRRLFWNAEKTAAGSGNPLESRARGKYVYLHVDADVEAADEIISVTGDSMEPTFNDGDALLVEYTHELKPGEIGIFVANGEGLVKEYRKNGLHSHNPAYPLRRFSKEDDVRCVGRVLRAVGQDEFASAEELEVLKDAERRS